MVEIRIAVTDDEKQAVYRSRTTASPASGDGRVHEVVDPEDENSWLIVAFDGDESAASYRVTRGSDGFSMRQVARYELEPFLGELPSRMLAVVERLVVPAGWSGDDLTGLFEAAAQIPGWDGVLVVFATCSPDLWLRWLPSELVVRAPASDRSTGDDDSGRVIAFPCGPKALIGLGHGRGLPACVARVLRGAESRLNSSG